MESSNPDALAAILECLSRAFQVTDPRDLARDEPAVGTSARVVGGEGRGCN